MKQTTKKATSKSKDVPPTEKPTKTQKKFIEGMKRNYRGMLRLFNMLSESKTMHYSLQFGDEVKEIDVDLRKTTLRQQLIEHKFFGGYRVINVTPIPKVEYSILSDLLKGLRMNTLKRYLATWKDKEYRLFDIEDEKGETKKLVVCKIVEKIIKKPLASTMLDYERDYLTESKIYTLTQQERNLYLSFSKYLEVNQRVFRDRNRQLERVMKKYTLTMYDVGQMTLWINHFLLMEGVKENNIMPLQFNVAKQYHSKHRKTKQVSYFESIIHKGTIELYLRARDDRNKFFNLLRGKYSRESEEGRELPTTKDQNIDLNSILIEEKKRERAKLKLIEERLEKVMNRLSFQSRYKERGFLKWAKLKRSNQVSLTRFEQLLTDYKKQQPTTNQ